MTERQLKLEQIVNEIDDNYGIGNGYVDENTDVDKFKKELLIEHDFSNILDNINENTGKSYLQILNEIGREK